MYGQVKYLVWIVFSTLPVLQKRQEFHKREEEKRV